MRRPAPSAFDEAVKFTKDRNAFGRTVFDFQNTRFTLADLSANLQVGWARLDWALLRHLRCKITAREALAAKLSQSCSGSAATWRCGCTAALDI